MANLYETDSAHITFHAKEKYDQPFGPQERAMTIAGFCVAQNSEKISAALMRRDIVTFLLSSRAVSWWIEKKRLTVVGKNDDGKSLIRLTPSGRSECEFSLRGQGPAGTNPETVSWWVQRMLDGGDVANKSKSFDLPL